MKVIEEGERDRHTDSDRERQNDVLEKLTDTESQIKTCKERGK